MTIAIGVIGSSDPANGSARGDTLILVADTQGTAADSSTDRLHKIFIAGDVYIAAAGTDMNRVGELVPRIVDHISSVPVKKSEAIFSGIHAALRSFHQRLVEIEVWSKYDLMKICGEDEDLKKLVREEGLEYDIGCELLIGTFDDGGRALLYQTYGKPITNHDDAPPTLEYLHTKAIPGFAAVGEGSDIAFNWLNYRNHTLSYSDIRSAYHAYEAKRMAEKNAYVNGRTDMLVATAHRHEWFCTGKSNGYWSVERLEEMFTEFGPRPTDTIPTSQEAPQYLQRPRADR